MAPDFRTLSGITLGVDLAVPGSDTTVLWWCTDGLMTMWREIPTTTLNYSSLAGPSPKKASRFAFGSMKSLTAIQWLVTKSAPLPRRAAYSRWCSYRSMMTSRQWTKSYTLDTRLVRKEGSCLHLRI